MARNDGRATPPCLPMNDNGAPMNPAEVDAALTRIAKAIGRHIAREHIRMHRASNDNRRADRP